MLPKAVRDYYGFAEGDGRMEQLKTSSLAELNDGGATFPELAAIIESPPDGLLVAG